MPRSHYSIATNQGLKTNTCSLQNIWSSLTYSEENSILPPLHTLTHWPWRLASVTVTDREDSPSHQDSMANWDSWMPAVFVRNLTICFVTPELNILKISGALLYRWQFKVRWLDRAKGNLKVAQVSSFIHSFICPFIFKNVLYPGQEVVDPWKTETPWQPPDALIHAWK